MSFQLKKYLLSGAKDTPYSRPEPQEGSNLALALRRHAHAYAVSKSNSKNRLSLDLDSKYGSTQRPYGSVQTTPTSSAPPVKYRGAVSDLSSITNRRSLDLENLAAPSAAERRRTVTFHLPDGIDPNTASTSDYITQYHYGNDPDYSVDTIDDRSSRSRRRRREELVREDSVDPSTEDHSAGVSAQLTKLVDMKPKSYAEAQRMKKMLKRAVSGPNATFEDLKVYRLAMKRLRRIVKEEQEREIEMANEEAQIKRDQEKVHK